MRVFTRVLPVLSLLLTVVLANTSDATVSSQLYASGFSRPVFLTHAPADSGREFVVEQGGLIKIVKGGTVEATPFLDLTNDVTCCNERGLLGLAFHPDYESNGYFYVNYTRASDSATVISRFSVSANPDSADETSETVLLLVQQPEPNHNGGCLQFGPDGMLYCGMGDGGGGFDQHGPIGNAQDPGTLLGKMIRLDVDAGAPYVPGDNPWAGVQAGFDTLDLIWAFGVRNPWRFSFDRATGDMYIGDVGQSTREEVDFQPATSPGGDNYGWRCKEGDNCTGLSGCTCADPLLTDPVYDYANASGECAVTGGYVYRGCSAPELDGQYLFGDYCSARIWAITHDGTTATDTTELTADLNPGGDIGLLSSFGEDAAGDLYIVDLGGEVFKIVSDQPDCGACSCPLQADLNVDTFHDAVDLNLLIGVIFFNANDPQDPDCPITRSDFNADTFADAVDLNLMIGFLFFNGPGPTDPCSP
ncbi:MAG: glucose dehydrogenase [candidate division Zixibacteria bacterium]|nr:glucose dehydrogenase [candidate division Zixibacteria bacterium]